MRITLVCNCGLLLDAGGQKLLIDAPNAPQAPYYELPAQELSRLIAKKPPYDGLLALGFTHTHPDHYCHSRVAQLQDARPDVAVFVPDAQTPDSGTVHMGCFTVEFHRLEHTPVPENLRCEHFVLLVQAEGKLVYITADAAPDAVLHRRILAGRVCDAAFWNGQYLSHAETRKLLQESAKKNYVYHVPVDPPDASGVRHKCMRNMERFSDELSGVTVLETYPSVLRIGFSGETERETLCKSV